MSALDLEACLAAIAEIEAQQQAAEAAEDDRAKLVSDYVLGEVAEALRERKADGRICIKVPQHLWARLNDVSKLRRVLREATGGTTWEALNLLDGAYMACRVQELAAGLREKQSAAASVRAPIECRYGFVRLTTQNGGDWFWVRMQAIGSICKAYVGAGSVVSHNGTFTEVRESPDELLRVLDGRDELVNGSVCRDGVTWTREAHGYSARVGGFMLSVNGLCLRTPVFGLGIGAAGPRACDPCRWFWGRGAGFWGKCAGGCES